MVQRCTYCGKCYFEAPECPHCKHKPKDKDDDLDVPEFFKDIFGKFGST